jgi:hypothetical protein
MAGMKASTKLMGRRLLPYAVVVALAAGVPPFARWVAQDAFVASDRKGAGEGSPPLQARGVRRILAREGGQVVWEFAAQRIVFSPDKRFATATGVSRGVYFREAKPYLRLSALRLRFDQHTRDWRASGDLHVSGPDGFELKTPQASWNQAAQRLDCPVPIEASLRGARISTANASYDAVKGELRSRDPVTVRSPRATLSGSPVVADVKKRIFTFNSGIDIEIESPLKRQ